MKPYPHQVELAKAAFDVLAEEMIVYLAAEERTGKTLTAILVAEKAKIQNVLVLTKKQALKGWNDTLAAFEHTKNYAVTNYHQAAKLSDDYDLVILDEAHNYLSTFPKPGKIWDNVAKLTKQKPLIYISATPYAQGVQLLYHQFKLSSWSPFARWSSAYSFFRAFGIRDTIFLSGRQVETYKKFHVNDVLQCCQHLFVTRTREELGFEHEPEDKLHYIELGEKTKLVYNLILKQRILELNGVTIEYDTTGKLRAALHMLEGGVAKTNDEKDDKNKKIRDGDYMILGNREKIDYILKHWGDTEDMVIMYHYKQELLKLQQVFKKAELLQGTSYAEGVDLSHKKHLIIYSQDWSTARHNQRRARQANKNRDEEIVVHFLLVKEAISDQVYQAVSVNKTNYIDSLFKGNSL